MDARTHPYISTGLRQHKFGIEWSRALDIYRAARRVRSVDVAGISCHIGSQITELRPFVAALERLEELFAALRAEGFDLRFLDLGGGLGIRYEAEPVPTPEQYAEALLAHVRRRDYQLLLEPGRVIVGDAGILLTRLLHIKENNRKIFYVVDAGMNDLIRPSLYQSFHKILTVHESDGSSVAVDVVGPVCETGDFLARDRQLAPARPGDLLAVLNAGAYGFALASNYNSRLRCAEVLVDGDQYRVIRKREEYEDLVRGEWPPAV